MSNDALSLNQYREVCSRLDHAYGVLLESDVLPVQGCTAESVSTRRRALAAGRFSVAICGQVKAGKSTLLNALVFQAPVLPADDLPMTAKITILRYRKETGLEVHFWSATEWADLVADYKADGNVYADFEDEIKQATLSGHPPGSWITADGRVVREEGLGGISKYVSVVANGGVLSPYVKEVIAFHDNDAFADVDVVDTPGVNDPSKLRAQLTERWIQGVDAVVYVSYAGHAMAEADVSFIRTHLGGVSRSRRVLAINKIDLVDRAGLERYVASLRSSPREEVRAVIAPATQTAFVAAGARLLIHARAKGMSMEGLEYSFHDPQWLDGLHDGMDTLRSMIEQRLTARRGQEFLGSHRAYLLRIADLLDIQCDKAREDLAAAREYLRTKHGALNAQRCELRSFKTRLRDAIDDLRRFSNEVATRAAKDIDGALQSMFWNVFSKVQNRISQETSLAKIRFATRISLQEAWTEYRTAGFDELQRIISEAREELRERVEEELQGVDRGVITARRLKLSIDGAILKELRQLESEYSASAAPEEVAKVIRDAVSFFGRLFEFASAISNAQTAVTNRIQESLASSRRALAERLQQEVSVRLQECISTIEADLRDVAEHKERELETILGSNEAELRDHVASFEERERRLDVHESRIRSVMDVLRAAASVSESP